MINRPTTYSFRWGWQVYFAFRERFGRATDIWREFTKFDDFDIVALITGDQRKWEIFKQQVKFIDKVTCSRITDQHALSILRSKVAKCPEFETPLPLKHLTASEKSLRIKKDG